MWIPLAEVLRYAVKLTPSLISYAQDGRSGIDNNLPETTLRGITVERKNCLLTGRGCNRNQTLRASIRPKTAGSSRCPTAKLNDVNPHVWLSNVLSRVGKDDLINNIEELPLW